MVAEIRTPTNDKIKNRPNRFPAVFLDEAEFLGLLILCLFLVCFRFEMQVTRDNSGFTQGLQGSSTERKHNFYYFILLHVSD